jgi:hypothetical protein
LTGVSTVAAELVGLTTFVTAIDATLMEAGRGALLLAPDTVLRLAAGENLLRRMILSNLSHVTNDES